MLIDGCWMRVGRTVGGEICCFVLKSLLWAIYADGVVVCGPWSVARASELSIHSLGSKSGKATEPGMSLSRLAEMPGIQDSKAHKGSFDLTQNLSPTLLNFQLTSTTGW